MAIRWLIVGSYAQQKYIRGFARLAAGTFFRRELFDRVFCYPDAYRIIGARRESTWHFFRGRLRHSPLPARTWEAIPIAPKRRSALQQETEPVDLLTRQTVLWSYRVRRILAGAAAKKSGCMHGHRTWYANLPEHVAFYSRQTMTFIANELNMDVASYRRMPHKLRCMTHRPLDFARHSLADHCVVVLRKRK